MWFKRAKLPVFEYVDGKEFSRTMDKLLEASKVGARFVYWNALVPRNAQSTHPDRLSPLEELAADLHSRSRAFFYHSLVVEEKIA